MTNLELKRKPVPENSRIIFDENEDKKSGNDLLPFISVTLKVKKWHSKASKVKVTDHEGKQYLKKKQTDDGVYSWNLGYIDDIKDKVTSGKFTVSFLDDKDIVEKIEIEIQSDGTFLVNGEKRGKF